VLDRIASLLEDQGANPFRSRAFRNGARHVRMCPRSMADLHATEGIEGLGALPGVGPRIAAVIRDLVTTGQSGYLQRLDGGASGEALLRTVPGIGPRTAHRLAAEIGVDTLEGLELAAHDGRLARLWGMGPRRIRAIRDVVAAMLARRNRRWTSGRGGAASPPDVPTLLSVDAEYRVAADAGALPRIAPRRFNPAREAWLPILHTERRDWHFTVVFSNTARAHELSRTRDWVVVHFERGGDEGQYTVVTETRGPLAGRRVVRGRERECAAHYAEDASAA
jgi:hypothetical protein